MVGPNGGCGVRYIFLARQGIAQQTLEIRAVDVTNSSIGNTPMLPDLLSQIPPDPALGSLTAEQADDTRKML